MRYNVSGVLFGKEWATCKEFAELDQTLLDEKDALCHARADKVLDIDKELRLDEIETLWLASRRTLARANNEAFDEDRVSLT